MSFDALKNIKSIEIGDLFSLLPSFDLGEQVLLLTSGYFARQNIACRIVESLPNAEVLVYSQVMPNPEVKNLESLKQEYNTKFSSIIALGGGSVLDTAKILSLWLGSRDTLFSALNDSCLKNVPLIPVIAIPTTAGTGAEVTPFATAWDRENNKKHSITGIKPSSVILDANMTLSLGRSETLYSALDALSHALESLWNINRTDKTSEYALAAIDLICHYLPKVLDKSGNVEAREKLLLAATLSGLAISETKTAIAHAISYPVTLQFGVPHGLACSFTLMSILNLYGYEKLNLSRDLADRVVSLLRNLKLSEEIERFVQWPDLLEQMNTQLDPSRAGNFAIKFGEQDILDIIQGARD